MTGSGDYPIAATRRSISRSGPRRRPELTDEGLEVVDAAVAALAVNDLQLLERLEEEEVAQLEAILRKLLGGLELPE